MKRMTMRTREKEVLLPTLKFSVGSFQCTRYSRPRDCSERIVYEPSFTRQSIQGLNREYNTMLEEKHELAKYPSTIECGTIPAASPTSLTCQNRALLKCLSPQLLAQGSQRTSESLSSDVLKVSDSSKHNVSVENIGPCSYG